MAALNHIILSQTCSKLWNDSIEVSEVDNHLEKIDFADLVKDDKSVPGFSPFLPILSRREWHLVIMAWLPRQFQNGGLLSHFFRAKCLQDSRHFRGWNFGEKNRWMFTCYGRRQKSKLFGVIFFNFENRSLCWVVYQ